MKSIEIKLLILTIISILSFSTSVYAAQTIYIIWDYDENSPILISDETTSSPSVVVGNIYISSNFRFKFYITPNIISNGEVLENIKVNSIQIGNKKISMNPSFPTPVKNWFIYGSLKINFLFLEPPDDFKLILTFVFLPF